MKKLFVFGLIVSTIPCLGFAENAKITKLMREKQQKMEQLEKCTGKTKGLMIAGVSTLGLTAVGVAGNIAEASKIKSLDSNIESTEKKIEQTEKEIREKREARLLQQEEEANRLRLEEEQKKQGRMLKNVALADIEAIRNGGNIGDKAISHGYMPERLPDGLRTQFANAMVSFISKCRSFIGMNGIKEVSLSPTIQENWRQFVGSAPLAEDYILPDLNEHIIAECRIKDCDLTTHTIATEGDGIYCKSLYENLTPGTDCLTGAKVNNPEATAATVNANGVCEITACSGGKVPAEDKKSCIYPNLLEEITVKNCKADVLRTLHATAGTEKEKGCYVQKCETGYHLELNGRKYAVDEFEGVDLNMKCVKDTDADVVTPKQGDDCLATALTKDTDAETAVINANGHCDITKCKTATKEPSADKEHCVNKTLQDGTDCTREAQKTDINVTKAEIIGGKCEIKVCYPPKVPSNDKKSCRDKQITEWTEDEKKADAYTYCEQLYETNISAQQCCSAKYNNNIMVSWNGSQCVCDNGGELLNGKCVDSSKDLKGKRIAYTRVMSEFKFKVNGTQYTAYSYDAKDASGNKMNCGAGSEGYNKCGKVAIRQKLEELGYTNIGEIVKCETSSCM